MKVSKGTIARTAILVLTIINSGGIVWICHGGRTGGMVEEQQLHSSRTESGRNDEGNARV